MLDLRAHCAMTGVTLFIRSRIKCVGNGLLDISRLGLVRVPDVIILVLRIHIFFSQVL